MGNSKETLPVSVKHTDISSDFKSQLRKYAAYLPPAWSICIFVALCAFLVGIYGHLYTTYILDEYYDGDSLRELGIDEKLTIWVSFPGDKSSVKKFVEHYSLCPCVHDIVIVTRGEDKTLRDISFQYQHTHSHVTFFDEKTSLMSYWTQTESLMLLDTGVFVSCADLKFTLNVWRSSQTSLVGYFPRIHSYRSSSSGNDGTEILYHGWIHVWWHRCYSLLTAGGVVMQKSVWQGYVGDSPESTALRSFVDIHPECFPVALPMWAAFTGATPPIWVDVPVSVDSTTDYSREFASSQFRIDGGGSKSPYLSRDSCLNRVAQQLKHPKLVYSIHKAAVAKNVLFW